MEALSVALFVVAFLFVFAAGICLGMWLHHRSVWRPV